MWPGLTSLVLMTCCNRRLGQQSAFEPGFMRAFLAYGMVKALALTVVEMSLSIPMQRARVLMEGYWWWLR